MQSQVLLGILLLYHGSIFERANMKKLFVSVLILACLLKPFSLLITILEDIGDYFPNNPVSAFSKQTILAHSSIRDRIIRNEKGAKKNFFIRALFCESSHIVPLIFLVTVCFTFFFSQRIHFAYFLRPRLRAPPTAPQHF